ncbi:unnamed protein product, partial [Adineta steineri]
MLTFFYNPLLENNRLSFHLTCSRDLFDEITVTNISRRLEYCVQQLFSSNETSNRIDTCFTAVSKIGLILPEETREMEDTAFCRQSHIINEAPASFAQIQLWHNKSIYFTPYTSQVPIHNMPFVYHLHNHHTLSIQHLRHALQLIIKKHESFHTSLLLNTGKNLVTQRIIDMNDDSRQFFTFIESTYETQERLNDILYDEKYNPHLFDLAEGLVLRCHIVYYKQISSNNILSDKDIIIFNFHHALFDCQSMNIFLQDLDQAYKTGQLTTNNDTTLRYIDYAVIERQMSMTGASMFWLDALHDCHLDQPLSLPFDQYRLMNEHQTNRTTAISFDFGQDLSHHFLLYTLSNNIKHEHLALVTYFIFLFKLTNAEKDLCISMNIDNRYRDELKSIIGLFENVIPLRCQLDPHWTYHYLLDYVREITTNSMKYSYFPLQRILNQHPNVSKPAFLDISFEFLTYMTDSDNKLIMIGDSQLSVVPFTMNINDNKIINKYDFSLLIEHDRSINQLSCTINASLDLFNIETIYKISQRFHSILKQLFTLIDNQMNKPIYEISVTLPNERLLMQSMNNTQISFPSSPLTCIHHEFVYQVMKHPQKLAVQLDDQSLTYAELLHYVQVLSLTLLNEYHVVPGDIVCQCVERSLSMVIGIMGIEMTGGVYCPLSPRDPQHRLHALTQQTQSRFVLVHYLTKIKFHHNIVLLHIDSIVSNNDRGENGDTDGLSNILLAAKDMAYIIFTSGSTGIPKAVQLRQQNLTNSILGFVQIDALHENDVTIQIASSTFDAHILEIVGSLICGATLAMLHPQGESMSTAFIKIFMQFVAQFCRVWNFYGPAEATLGTSCHQIDVTSHIHDLPIGRPLPRYMCLVLNNFLQSTVTQAEGELLVGGLGVFAGYFGRDDLTANALLEINGDLFYRTGDLVTIDNNGLLHYHGRKDHQIKLHGQRIELGEIERCLLSTTSISACVVMKWNDDYLVAYVQSSDIAEKQLREYCQSHLPPHMIPSIFVILEKLPLNANGKIDRKLLPPPNFSSAHLTDHDELLLPMNENEIVIHQIWCDLLKQKQISTNTNIFTLGGHSLLIMQLFHRYKIEFHLETNTFSITDLFQRPTIIDHAQLIYQTINMIENTNDHHWSSLQLIQARASFAQERIFLDEQIRFSSTDNDTNNMYVIALIYRISSMNDHISISRLQHAFQTIITEHQVLRTALSLDTNGTIIQHCLDTNAIINDKKSSGFSIIDLPDEEHEQNEIMKQILNQSDLFNLSKGHVVNCHIFRRDQSNHALTQNNDDLLTKDDLVLFTIHHACFDGASVSIFIRDLSLAYQSNDLLPIDDNSIQYIDYSVHEHIMDMSLSREFWQIELKGYNLARQLSLPIDRQRLSTNQQRSGLASSAQIIFDDKLCTSFLNYASSHHLTLFQLGLSIFYVFLFKLSHGETDLCIGSINANRYRNELQNLIGMFVSTLPYRVELDLHWSFDEVVKYVQEKCLSILEHSHYPLQHILGDLHLTQSNVSFLEIMFDFITVSNEGKDLCLNGVNLEQVSLNESYEVAKFDFSLNFIYNSLSDDNQLSCSFVCSNDLFHEITLTIICQRFQHVLEQVFSSKSSTNRTSISKVDFILPEEVEERQAIMFHRLENISNEAPASFAQCRIWSQNQRDADTDQSSLMTHNVPFFYHLYAGGILSVQQLRHALGLIVTKHESLHTSLIYDCNNNQLMQRVLTQQDINNEMFTITESTYETDEQLNGIIEHEKCNPQLFDLAQVLVFRCHIIYYKQISSNNILSDKDIIIFNFHHAFFDYLSMDIFLHDLDQAYKTGQITTDNTTTLRYIDYAFIEQQISMTGASMFWLDALHNCHLDQSLSLPYDRYRLSNEHRTGRGTSISFDFGQDLSHDFLIYASSNNIKHEHLALATYYVFLFKLTNGEKDLCVAMNIDNRYRDELKSIIGLFENVIPLRCQLVPRWSFYQLAKHIHETTTDSMKYSYFPLQRILNQHPNVSKPAFLDLSFEFLSSMTRRDNKLVMVGDSQLSSIPVAKYNKITNKYDFSVIFQHDVNINELSCTINASLDLFNVETTDKISQRFHSILNQLLTSVDDQVNKSLYEISLTLPNERLLMQSMNNTQVSFPSPVTCIHHAFACQVMKHPQKLAVELDEQSLTYAELLHYVQVLSLTLLNEYHVFPDEVVIGILAIEMSGGVYCPLSPRDPQHRLHTLVKQTESRLVLSHWLTRKQFDDDITTFDISLILINNDIHSSVDTDQLSNIIFRPDNIAYIIFTSGSTGIPKAVQVRHKNLCEFMCSLIYGDVVNEKDTILQIARCSFDVHVQDIMGTFMIGSSLIMLHPRGIMDFDYLASVMKEKSITCITTVPTIIHSFFTFVQQYSYHNVTQYLRSVCSGGEPCSMKLINLVSNTVTHTCRLWNMYGPAETTIDCTFHLSKNTMESESFPTGTPLSNYQNLILDQFSQSVFIDQEGELFVGGIGVFAGYLGRDDLTAKALVEIDYQLFYRTGDLVRMDNNGLLHYQGRKDHQIKLHGQRIELGEIERCLLNITSISACVVIKWNDDYLVAYIQSSDIKEEGLREHCQSHLPPHMIPSVFIILEKLPLNLNGKIDRKLLPPPDFSSSIDNIDGNVAHTTLEKQLQDIFSQAFHIESPRIEISFGQLGGTSLGAIIALTLIRQQICNKVDVGLLFTNPSIRQLAIAIEPSLVFEELQETVFTTDQSHKTHIRFSPSFVIESVGTVFLVCQWLISIMIIHQWCPLFFPILPICHLLFYVICSQLLSRRNIKDDNVFSWNYYRWWFLDRLWNNNTFWLQHIVGTPLYNNYLRLCGARISLNTYIYTTSIDAPWLLEIDDGSWIANETYLNCLHFNDDNTFKLSPIRIGSNCSIGAQSILFDGVDMQNNIIVQPMSAITGFVASETIVDGEEHKSLPSDISIAQSNRSLSIWHKIYQIIVIISLICIHYTLLILVYKVYSVRQIPLLFSIAFCWTLWSIIGCFISLLLLKFVVGPCTAGEIYPIASWLYLQKIWLRQLIVSSFHYAWLLPTGYDYLYPCVLRWLGAHIEENVKLAQIDPFLSCPTNLLKLEKGVTTFGGVLIVPTELTFSGDHRVDQIVLGSHTNLANGCSIMPGSCLASETMVGNLTRISRETKSKHGEVFMGVPARSVPFQMPPRLEIQDQIEIIPFWHTCLSHYVSKCLLLSIYSFGGLVGGSTIHTILVCSLYRCRSYIRYQIIEQIITRISQDHAQFICPFLGNTQWLIRLFRAYGAHIGENTIMPAIFSITD